MIVVCRSYRAKTGADVHQCRNGGTDRGFKINIVQHPHHTGSCQNQQNVEKEVGESNLDQSFIQFLPTEPDRTDETRVDKKFRQFML